MKLVEIKHKVNELFESEFMDSKEMTDLDHILLKFVKELQDFFGYNDGEPLDEDGIKFVIELFRLRMLESHGVYEDE